MCTNYTDEDDDDDDEDDDNEDADDGELSETGNDDENTESPVSGTKVEGSEDSSKGLVFCLAGILHHLSVLIFVLIQLPI